MIRIFLGALLALSFVACSAQPKPSPRPEPVKPVVKKDETKRVDPFEDKLSRFRSAYEEMACRANRDFDPMANVVTLRDPYDLLKDMVEQQAVTLEIYERIIQRYGFKDVEHYFKEKEYIDTARPKWFRGLQNSLYDVVTACEEIDKGVRRETP